MNTIKLSADYFAVTAFPATGLYCNSSDSSDGLIETIAELTDRAARVALTAAIYKLNLSCCILDPEQEFPAFPNVTEVDLSQCGYTTEDSLARLIRACPRIETFKILGRNGVETTNGHDTIVAQYARSRK